MSRFRIAMSFKAYGLKSTGLLSRQSIITDRSSISSLEEITSPSTLQISPGRTLARKPSLPMFTPIMGVPFVPTSLAVLRNVPSPPIEMA